MTEKIHTCAPDNNDMIYLYTWIQKRHIQTVIIVLIQMIAMKVVL